MSSLPTSQQTLGQPPPAKRSLGQHFLVDRRVVGRILTAAEVSSEDLVVEVGPGRGILTKELAERAGRVVAVEVDEALATRLAQQLGDGSNVTIVPADAREVAIETLVPQRAPYKLVANLPYYAASPIVRRFLEARHKPRLMVVMLQREVARNMAAAPGKMGLLSVAVQLHGLPRIVSYVPPRAFRPSPTVTSAIVRIDVYDKPALALDSEDGFFELVRAGFSAPRKQIRNSLKQGLPERQGEVETRLAQAGIDAIRRAETLSLAEWGSLYEAFQGDDHRRGSR